MLVKVKDGKVTGVQGNPDHPFTQGRLCAKTNHYQERVYHPERVLYPMRRTGPKGAGQFERIGWDEALETVSARLRATIARSGPHAILPYSYLGTQGLVNGLTVGDPFFNKLGATVSERTFCDSGACTGYIMTVGPTPGMDPESFQHSRLIILWACNMLSTNAHMWPFVEKAQRSGAKLIVIDPVRTRGAQQADQHIRIRPGTDAALALAMMHVIVNEGLTDADYVEKYTTGFDELKAHVQQYTPEFAAEVTGVDAEVIRVLAREYATVQPSAIRIGVGIERSAGGGQLVRVVTSLPALVGAWRHRAGGLLLSSSGVSPFNKAALQLPQLLGDRRPRTLNMSTIGDVLLHPGDAHWGPQVEAVVVYNSNPVAVAPESAKVAAGFAREDLFTVVLEHFLTDTADHADYVLPATTQLEHWDIHGSYGHTDVLLNRPAIAPEGQARSNAQIFSALAAHMARLDPAFAAPHFHASDEALCRMAVAQTAVNFDALLQHGFARIPLADAPFAEGGFATPSGKCEFDNPLLAQRGINTLPDYLPNYETPTAAYPLAMISPPARNFLNSSFANVASLQRMEERPLLELHPEDAATRGIADGDALRVFNARGEHVCHASLNGRARAGVVVGLGLWWRKHGANGTNVNELTHQQLTDIGRAPCFYDCAVQVERLA